MGGESLHPGRTRKFGFAGLVAVFSLTSAPSINDCLICSLLQVISLIHSAGGGRQRLPGPRVPAGTSIRLKNERDPKNKFRPRFCECED